MKIMGIDYGDARTGVAISDLLCTLVGSATVVLRGAAHQLPHSRAHRGKAGAERLYRRGRPQRSQWSRPADPRLSAAALNFTQKISSSDMTRRSVFLPQCCRTAAAIRRGKVWILPVCPDGFSEWMRERRRGSLSYPPRRSSCFHLIQWSCFQQPRPLPRGPFAPAYFSVPCGATFAPSSARLIFQRSCAG